MSYNETTVSSCESQAYSGLVVQLQVAPAAPLGTVATPSAHRKRLSGFERRAQLQEIARDLFAQHGYHHISMDDIAASAQVTKPVLYKHFPSKLELYLAIIEQLTDDLIASASEDLEFALASAPAPANAYPSIKAIFDAYVKFVHDHGLAASLLFESDVTRDKTLRVKLNLANTSVATLLREALTRALQCAPRDIAIYADAITAMAKNLATESLHSESVAHTLHWPNTHALAQYAWAGLATSDALKHQIPPTP